MFENKYFQEYEFCEKEDKKRKKIKVTYSANNL